VDQEGARPRARNDVYLVGTLSNAPERRTLPSGDELLAFTVAVPRPGGKVDAVPVQLGPAPPAGGRAGPQQVGRRRLAVVERFGPGTMLEVRGALRRRWWRAGGASVSRLEVAACSVEPVAPPVGAGTGS
jgi:single-strand DNA-binding protein